MSSKTQRLFDEVLSADLQNSLLQYGDDVLSFNTEEGYRQAPKGLLETLQALFTESQPKTSSHLFIPQVIGIGYHLEEG